MAAEVGRKDPKSHIEFGVINCLAQYEIRDFSIGTGFFGLIFQVMISKDLNMLCNTCGLEEENKESGLCTHCEDKEARKINGILYLPALGIIGNIVSGFLSLYVVFSLFISTYNSSGEVTVYGMCLLSVLMINIIITLSAAWFFFRRHMKTKKVMIVYYIFGLFYALVVVVFPVIYYEAIPTKTDIRTLVGSIIGVVAWIPYFLLSKRVPVVFSR
ncbi:hypothetical protein CS536_18500 [Yersinia kristensenii]|nr:hypothetical protein CS536_18500 [Yersinia kristensenii]